METADTTMNTHLLSASIPNAAPRFSTYVRCRASCRMGKVPTGLRYSTVRYLLSWSRNTTSAATQNQIKVAIGKGFPFSSAILTSTAKP